MSTSRFDELVEEIERVVNSPYPTQLKHLRDLLCTTCTESDVSRWVVSKPCQLDKLVRCILDGLAHWPYVLDIITRLSRNVAIRDAFLNQEPTVLHSIIVHAIQSHNGSSRYTIAAVTMLSHPLPKHVALPADVQSLFVHLFDRAAQQPSVNNIRPLYRIFKGTSTLLLGLLSNSVLLRLEDHLFDILRNLKGDDQSLSLFCLAIMQTLASSKRELSIDFPVSSYDTQELLASTQRTSTTTWKPDTVQQFFTATKAQRTMQLIALRVMWACNASTGDSIDEKTESLMLANDIVTAVPVLERETWRKSNVLLLKKFEEKVLSPLLDLSIRFHALCFLSRLMEGSIIPPAVINSLRETVLKAGEVIGVLHDCNSEAIEYLISCGVFDESTTTSFVQNVVDFTTSAIPEQILQKSSALVTFLRQLNSAMVEQDGISDGIMLAFDVLSCGSKMSCLASLVKTSPNELIARPGRCAQALYNARNRLVHELCRVLLRATLSGRQVYSISPDSITSALDLYALTARSDKSCTHTQPTVPIARTQMAFVESESTPEDNTANWREALKSELNARVEAEHQRLSAIFATSCKELEMRCENVEQPLRVALHQNQQLQQKCDELQEVVANLESDKIDRTMQFNVLEAERDQALDDIANVRDEQVKSDAMCKDLERKLFEATREAQEDIEQVKQSMEAAELGHSTTLAKKEEEVETLQAEVAKSKEDLLRERQANEEAMAALEQAKSEAAYSREEVEQLKVSGRQHQANMDSLTEKTDGLLKTNEMLSTDVANANAELASERENYHDIIRRMEGEKDQKLTAAEEHYRQQLTNLTNTHDEVLQGLKRKLADVESESDDARARHLKELEDRDSESLEKQRKIDRLHRKCEQKDRQIADANAMRSNLMAAMGLDAGRPLAALPHRPSRSSTTQTSNEDEQETQNDPSPPTPCSGEDEFAQNGAPGQSFLSNVSSNDSRSGPTPKRPRSKRSSRSTPPAQPRLRISTASRPSRSTAKRQPLASISNNSPKKIRDASAKTTSHEHGIGPDETTFDGSELFAGTPLGIS